MEDRFGLQKVLGKKGQFSRIGSGQWGSPHGRHKGPPVDWQDCLRQFPYLSGTLLGMAERAAAAQARAVESIESDENVRALIASFNGVLDRESIAPIEGQDTR